MAYVAGDVVWAKGEHPKQEIIEYTLSNETADPRLKISHANVGLNHLERDYRLAKEMDFQYMIWLVFEVKGHSIWF
jgi:hypothetical protein